jgi:streptogramin lyase
MSSRNSHHFLAVVLIGFCIAACGGGGGGGSTGAAVTPLSDGSSGQGGATPTPSMPSSPGSSTSSSGAPVPSSSTPAPSPSSPQAPATADATLARFRGPQGVALNANGDLYVADTQNYTIRKIAANGVVTTIAGSAGTAGSADGAGAVARFTEPRGVALDSTGNVYVTDGSVIRRISLSGTVTTIAGTQGQFGDDDGTGSMARFRAPNGIAVDAAGNVYVADIFDSALRIRKISPVGVVSTFAGGNSGGSAEIPRDGVGTLAAFVGPTALAFDSAGNLYVADVAMGGLTAPNLYDGATFIRKISPTGVVTTVAGNYGFGSLPAGGPVAQISRASAIAVDGSGNIFVTDRFNNANRVQKISPSGSISVLPLDASQFGTLAGLAIDTGGELYASDKINQTIVKISQSGTVLIYAGKTGEAGSVDTP